MTRLHDFTKEKDCSKSAQQTQWKQGTQLILKNSPRLSGLYTDQLAHLSVQTLRHAYLDPFQYLTHFFSKFQSEINPLAL